MQFPSRYALLVCGPLSIVSVGCSAVTQRPVASAASSVSNADRLLSMAQVYEQKGQLQQAHKLYCQVLQENPNHAVAREHATDLMAAISQLQSTKDPGSHSQVASSERSKSGLTIAKVAPAPTDPALMGKKERKILSEDEVAARIPKPRALAKAMHARQATVATVTHEETKTGTVTPAEQVAEEPLAPLVMTVEQPITVVELPGPIELPAVEPLVTEPKEQVVASVDVPSVEVPAVEVPAATLPVITSSRPATVVEAAPVLTAVVEAAPAVVMVEAAPVLTTVVESAPAVITIESAPATTWVKTPAGRLCPNAPEHLHGCLANLESSDPEARKAALEELVECGRGAVTCLPAIRDCLKDADLLVQGHAAWAIWSITGQSSEAIACLNSILACEQEEAVVFACYVLGTMGPQAQPAVPMLTRLQNDDSTGVRVHAAEAMLKVSNDGSLAIRVLTASLASHRADERSLAAVALGAAGPQCREAAISALITSLYDEDAEVRCSAALALGGFGKEAKASIAALEVAASATDAATRDAAMSAIACIRK